MEREYLYDRAGVEGSAGSTWLAGAERPAAPPLTGESAADVVVVGAGLFGTLTAVRLARGGAKVALVEGRRAGSLVTGHTSAKVSAQHHLVSQNVSSHARVPWLAANVAAVERLEGWARIAGERAKFARADAHVYTVDPGGMLALQREADLYRQAGVRGGLVTEGSLPPDMLGAVYLSDQAIMDPVGLIDGLLDTVGGNLTLYEGSLVNSVIEDHSGVTVSTPAGAVRADCAVVASHVPFFDTLLYMTRLFQQRSYVLEARLPASIGAPAGMWFRDDHEVSWRPGGPDESDTLVISGQTHMAGDRVDERAYYARLAQRARERFGSELEVTRHWSTQDAHSLDGLPYIGKMHGRHRTYMASGFHGWGMTSSEVASEVVAGLIDGTADTELADLLSPLRVRGSGMVKLAVENAEVVAKAFGHELAPEGDPESIGPGEGRAMRSEYGHVAVMRDAAGKLHMSDAHCTHMRCGVEWNAAEGTWDCPCHGSRYQGDGRWLQGPTRRPLEPPRKDANDVVSNG